MMQKTQACPRPSRRPAWVKHNNGGAVKPYWTRRLARLMDRMITACQEWLEGPDRRAVRLVALAVIITSVAYVAVHLFLKLSRGN